MATIKVSAADLQPGDRTTGYEIVSTRKATKAEIADLWGGDGPQPPAVTAARVRWIDGGESDRFWVPEEVLEITRD